MNKEEAKEALLYHAFSHPLAAESKKGEDGFLGSLRPYKGYLIEANFHELMSILKVFANDLLNETEVDKEIVGSFWGICFSARRWALEPGGMLQRNKLISEEDIQKMDKWIDIIEYAMMMLLEGGSIDEAFHEYEENYKS